MPRVEARVLSGPPPSRAPAAVHVVQIDEDLVRVGVGVRVAVRVAVRVRARVRVRVRARVPNPNPKTKTVANRLGKRRGAAATAAAETPSPCVR